MIYSEMGGRCGNQLFLYSFSRKLEGIYGEGIAFNFYQIKEKEKIDPSWRDELRFFNVRKYDSLNEEKPLIYKYGNPIQILVYIFYMAVCKLPYKTRPDFYKRQEKLQPFINKFGIYNLVHGYSPIVKTSMNNQFVCGTYEDERWFSDIKNELQREITPKIKNPKNQNLLKLIEESESVCVSIRRGDFLESNNRKLRDVCNEEYYYEAIKVMKEKKPNAKFIFFSDEIDWVRENYDFGVESFYEDGTDDICEKLRLMYSCKNFIMSNSTFCWWAQFLSISNEKIVISPERWFNMPGYHHQLIGDDWILIKVDERGEQNWLP